MKKWFATVVSVSNPSIFGWLVGDPSCLIGNETSQKRVRWNGRSATGLHRDASKRIVYSPVERSTGEDPTGSDPNGSDPTGSDPTGRHSTSCILSLTTTSQLGISNQHCQNCFSGLHKIVMTHLLSHIRRIQGTAG
ncbi:MAG: hypothetical protein ABJZ55_08590 [Fuerstiella sp.]